MEQKQNKTIFIGIATVFVAFVSIKLVFFLLGPAVYSFDAQTRMDTGVSSEIEKELLAHCNCDDVQQFFLMQGYQYEKQESFGKRADFKIFSNNNVKNQKSEMKRLNTILTKNVECYSDLDLITIEFVSNKEHSIFSVQNGIINN